MTRKPPLSVSARARAIEPTLIREITDRARPSSIHLGLGQPDIELSEELVAAAQAIAGSPRALYTPNLGLDATREAVAAHYGVDPAEVMITCGVQEALAVAIFGLVDPGQKVLVPSPGFPAYDNLVRAAGAEPLPYPLLPDDNWQIDLERLEELARNADAIVLNSPSNPTGGVQSRSTVEAVAALCERNGLTWISDDIYEDFVYDTDFVSPWDIDQSGLKLSGLSKSHALMGWRIGWILADARTIQGLKPLHQHLVTCASRPAQELAVVALNQHQETTDRMRSIFRKRRRRMLDGLSSIKGLDVEANAGAFYFFVDTSRVLDPSEGERSVARMILDEVDVVTIPGAGFGSGFESWLRLAYTAEETVLDEACRRLARFFVKHENH